MGSDIANPVAEILSVGLMLDYVAKTLDEPACGDATTILESAVGTGFFLNRLRPMEFGGNMGLKAIIKAIASLVDKKSVRP